MNIKATQEIIGATIKDIERALEKYDKLDTYKYFLFNAKMHLIECNNALEGAYGQMHSKCNK